MQYSVWIDNEKSIYEKSKPKHKPQQKQNFLYDKALLKKFQVVIMMDDEKRHSYILDSLHSSVHSIYLSFKDKIMLIM